MPGWGSELWGVDEWGSQHTGIPLHIPTSAEFISADVSNTQLSPFLDYIEVAANQGYPYIAYDSITTRLSFSSADAFTAAEILVSASNTWTFEANIQPISLPPTFADLNLTRVFLGAFYSQGYGGGIAISKQGIAIVNTLTDEAYAIPGSMNVIPEGTDLYTIRLVVAKGMMYVYITPTSLLPVTGHILKYTTDALESPVGANDGVLIDLQGSSSQTVSIVAQAIRFNGHEALIPFKRPVAIPGPDQSVAVNTTATYDGSASYDPQGLPLTYAWSLVGTPSGSVFSISGVGSIASPNVLLGGSSDTFSKENAPLLQPGDTVVLSDGSQCTVAVGSPAMWEITPTSNGRYVRVSGIWQDDRIAVVETLPSIVGPVSWTIYHTSTYFNDSTLVTATAIPDQNGVYTVQLVVYDGTLYSLPVVAMTEVTTTTITFGVIPDVSWIWFHLTDFMNMLEDIETVEKVWSGFAQGAANVLLMAWQIDYNKSLKDIQSVFQKRWLSYSLILGQDPNATVDWNSMLVESTVIQWTMSIGNRFETACRFDIEDKLTGKHVKAWANTFVQTDAPSGQDWNYGRLLLYQFYQLWDAIRGPYGLYDYTRELFVERATHYTIIFDGWYLPAGAPIDQSIESIPRLQERIDGATGYLSQYSDFDIVDLVYQAFSAPNVRVVPDPIARCAILKNPYTPNDPSNPTMPDELWAEVTYVDNKPTIEANFGRLVELTVADYSKVTSNTDYRAAVRGLWYAYFRGPSLYTVQIGTQILLGMPFAEEEGIVESIDLTFSATQGRMLLRDAANATTVRSYVFEFLPDPSLPREASIAVNANTKKTIAVGDVVAQFEPLSNGIQVLDYLKPDSTWPGAYLGLIKEIEKLFSFLVRANVDTFSHPDLTFALQFVKNIKPHYTKMLFVLLKQIFENGPIIVTDHNTIQVNKLTVTSADQRNIGGFRWDDNIAGNPFPLPFIGEDDGRTLHSYDALIEDQFLHDQPEMFPHDRSSVLASVTFVAPFMFSYDSIWAYDDGGGTDILPLSGPNSDLPAPYGPLVGVILYDTTYPAGTYSRQWWL